MAQSSSRDYRRQIIGWMARQGAKRYIAGRSIDSAEAACHRSMKRVDRFIICPWDRPDDSPTTVFDSYLQAIDRLSRSPLDTYLSVKFPSLGFDRSRLETLLQMAGPHRIRIHLDALTADSVTPTLHALRALRGRYADLGYTVPGRWRRSLSDLPHLLDLAIPLRIVKGQLPDRSGGERAPQEGFLNLIDLIRPGTVTIGVATHDIELAKQSLARLTERGIPTELEQLYRLRPISGDSYPAVPRRLYVPYGYGYPPYDLYAALRRPRQALRLATDVLCGMCIRSSSLVRSAGDSPTEGIRHCP